MNAPIRTDENGNKKPLRERAGDWLFSQGVSTVLLFAILCAVGYMGHYAMTVGIPLHLQQIQNGYREIQSEHKMQQKDLIERLQDDRKRDREWSSMEREKDRAEWVRVLKADK